MKETMITRGVERDCQISYFVPNFGRNLNPTNQSKSKLKAFTLAEVLITLAIIGVVAALTIPTVITNYQKNTYVTQLKKNYSNIQKGFKNAMAKDGVTRLDDTVLWSKIQGSRVTSEGGYSTMGDNRDFLNEFSKYFNVSKIYYGSDGLKINGDFSGYRCLGSSSRRCYRVDSGIVLSDGTILYPSFLKEPNYNSLEINGKKGFHSLQEVRAAAPDLPITLWQKLGSIKIDVNGLKGPNVQGRDLFTFVIGVDGSLHPLGGFQDALTGACFAYWLPTGGVALGCLSGDAKEIIDEYSWTYDMYESCDPNDTGTEGSGCAARIMREGWKMTY